jgi:DNA repair photolyase
VRSSDDPAPAPRAAIKGRGSAENPPNRFERLHYLEDPEADDADAEPARPRTLYLRDPSRTILATNESPDVGFDASVNPYRGCEHGCVYCLAPETLVLHADLIWRPLGDVRIGDALLGFDELPGTGGRRKLRPALVEAAWWSRRSALRLVTNGTEVLTTAEHRWLQWRSFRWSRTEQLTPGRILRRLAVVSQSPVDEDYRAGYVAGLSLGDGTFRYEPGQRSDKLGFPQAYWRIALIDREPLERIVDYLESFGVRGEVRAFDPGHRSTHPMWKVEIRSLAKLEVVSKLLTVERTSAEYRRGFVAGFFDAEGHNGSSLRISQVDVRTLERVRGYARSSGFEFRLEPRPGRASTIRLIGSVAERIRFFSTYDPAITRKRQALFATTRSLLPDPVVAIERAGTRDVVDIQTSTGTFFAAGLATHNCYARPTHEYLGFSAGLDFETRILVKEDAPELLRRALAAPRYEPRVIALSGVTDAYQPVEQRLRLTRRCLEVLAEFRNPTAIVTKSRLVARDADLLGELARHGAASVHVSVTSLDPELQRRMEPRASSPRLRLEAIEALARAGIPVGVMVGPVIPGLTDHEIPAILDAAAGSGARFASWILLRLPHGVAGLFEAWLDRHAPERKARVLHRIQEVRGGRLNDPRFGSRMRGEGLYAEQIGSLFALAARRAGLARRGPALSTRAFRRPGGSQLALFGSDSSTAS